MSDLLDPTFQDRVSVLVESQFPDYYREHGPLLVAFVREYYEWMETEGPLSAVRGHPTQSDVDTCADEFLVHFKNKYLRNVQLETSSNVRFLVKHSLDLYRSRGTPRAVDLLFRLVFGTGAQVYYPWKDVFRLSSGKWHRPKYVEVALSDDLEKLIGLQVRGTTSGATAFVERVVRKRAGPKLSDVIYLSSVAGNFQTGERLNPTATPLPTGECPTIVGSLTELLVTDGGQDFEVGDQVTISGGSGSGALARVTEVTDATGVVSFEILDGGYGYSAQSQVLVSELVLNAEEVQSPSGRDSYLDLFETLTQSQANLNYVSATAHPEEGDDIYTYHANGDQKGHAVVLTAVEANSTAGNLVVTVLSGDVDEPRFYWAANANHANAATLGGFSDRSASGRAMAESAAIGAWLPAPVTGSFQVGERVTCGTAEGVVAAVTSNASGTSLSVQQRAGTWLPGQAVTGVTSGAEATLGSVSCKFGVINVAGTFLADERAPVRGATSNLSFELARVGSGTGAGFSVSPSLLYPETVSLITDWLHDYETVGLGDADYGFPGASGGSALELDEAVTYESFTFGKVQALVSVAGGGDYDQDPMVRIWEPRTASGRKDGTVMAISNASASFSNGEVVTQGTTGARGLVRSANSTSLVVSRLSVRREFAASSNSATLVTGDSSGATCWVDSAGPDQRPRSLDVEGRWQGLDAVIGAAAGSAEGSAAKLAVVDSGHAYRDLDQVSFESSDGSRRGGARVRLGRHGTGRGTYLDRGGHLSGDKKLRDGHYYQDYSYEVRASVTLDKYRDMLRDVLHVAGTRAFGQLRVATTLETTAGVASASASKE